MRSRGLTLVEMVAALTISALLAMATLGVVRSMVRSERADARADEAGIRGPLRQVIAGDLMQARELQPTARGLAIRTMSSLGPDLEQGHLPSLVMYEIRPLAGRNWLVRVQRPEVNAPPSTELVAAGVQALAVEPVLPPPPEGEPEGEPPQPDAGGWLALPDALAVLVTFDDAPPLHFVVRRVRT